MTKTISLFFAVIILGAAIKVVADVPSISSAAPVIYLADNLDEKDKLGWCIDTEGRGFAEKLQSHSCKPDRGQPNDTQFSYDKSSGQIRSVPFAGKCMAFNNPSDKVWPFGLVDCVADESAQQFIYDATSMEIQLTSDTSQCVVVAPTSIIAGPFMSRDLLVGTCASVDEPFKQWVVKD